MLASLYDHSVGKRIRTLWAVEGRQGQHVEMAKLTLYKTMSCSTMAGPSGGEEVLGKINWTTGAIQSP